MKDSKKERKEKKERICILCHMKTDGDEEICKNCGHDDLVDADILPD